MGEREGEKSVRVGREGRVVLGRVDIGGVAVGRRAQGGLGSEREQGGFR